MSNHPPIGACCAQPRFSDIGDDCSDVGTDAPLYVRLAKGARTFNRIATAGGISATMAALFAAAFRRFAR